MSKTGRYYTKDLKTGKTFCIEPMDSNERRRWGDQNPSSGKLEGSYGEKHKGSVEEEDSIITKDKFKNIVVLPVGESPDKYINKILKRSK